MYFTLCAQNMDPKNSKRIWKDLSHIINEQTLDEMTAKMLIIKIIHKKTEDFRRADIYVAILKKKTFNHLKMCCD